MKISSIFLGLTFLSTAFAAPGNSGHEYSGKKGKCNRKFTSTYSVVATPKQVVNVTEDGDFYYTGGLPVSMP